MSVHSTIDRYESEVRGYCRSFPTVFESAKGSWITDTSGTRYLDFFAGAGTLNYGHNNPRVLDAIRSYIDRDGIMHGLDTATKAKIEFIEAFQTLILEPRKLDYKVQFTGPTGTNSVEAAIKLARKTKQRSHVVAFTNAYHGHSLGSLALTGNQYYHDLTYGSHNNVTHLPYDGYLGEFDTSLILEKMVRDSSSGLPLPAAVIVETVQGEGGINVASFDWLGRVAKICAENDILFIVDDIQVGNGRTGTFFSFEPIAIQPDIVCLSKAIGGGLPMSLVLIKPEIDTWKPGQHTGTFRGNNFAFVAAKALLPYWKDDHFALHIKRHESKIQSHLQSLHNEFSDSIKAVRGRGMIWGIEFTHAENAAAVRREAFDSGLLIETSGANDQVVKLLPPLTISVNDLAYGLDCLSRSIRHVHVGSSFEASRGESADLDVFDTDCDLASYLSAMPILV